MTKSRAVFPVLKKQRKERSIDGAVLASVPFQGQEAVANLLIQQSDRLSRLNVCLVMAGQLHTVDAQLLLNWCVRAISFGAADVSRAWRMKITLNICKNREILCLKEEHWRSRSPWTAPK